LLGEAGKTTASNVLIRGGGGLGKTTLAAAACHDKAVVDALPDGIFWSSFVESGDSVTQLKDLYISVTGRPCEFADRDSISRALATHLEGSQCLVVLDNVWRTEDLKTFRDLRRPGLLVTSRIGNLLEQTRLTGWNEIVVEEMKLGEAAALLGRELPFNAEEMRVVSALAAQLGNWPLLLDLANRRLLEESKGRAGRLGDAVQRVVEVFRKSGVVGFDIGNESDRNTAVARSVGASLEFAERERPGITLRAREMSIFPEGVSIPVQALADLWKLQDFDVEENVIQPLANLSIFKWDRIAGDVSLHNMIRLALANRFGGAAEAHGKLVAAWNDPFVLPYVYAWRWFGWHCLQAGRDEKRRLFDLLLDFEWLQVRVTRGDILDILTDFDAASRSTEEVETRNALIRIGQALRRSKHHLAKRPQLLVQLLHNRLVGRAPNAPTLAKTVEAAAEKISVPWLSAAEPANRISGRGIPRSSA
jgi:hypothetical protein